MTSRATLAELTAVAPILYQSSPVEGLFQEKVLGEARFAIAGHWACEARRYEGPGTRLAQKVWPAGNEHVFLSLGDGVFAYMELGSGEVRAEVASPSAEASLAALDMLRERLPATEAGARCPVVFWSDHPQGPRRVTRNLSVPTWDEIAANYPLDVAHELERLVSFRPSAAGQLVLWRGEPGTGKTWALRALAREWSEWARFHYVTDPDCLFGHNASYMLSVLLDDDGGQPISSGPGSEDPVAGSGLWKVLLLEDAGEMLSRDARERSGQGLSRLLNLVDGLIGQGLRVLCIVTTNEELGSLHPAIARPGRCAVNLEFRPLSLEEAQAWLSERGGQTRLAGPASIADLYAMLAGVPIPAVEFVGFVN